MLLLCTLYLVHPQQIFISQTSAHHFVPFLAQIGSRRRVTRASGRTVVIIRIISCRIRIIHRYHVLLIHRRWIANHVLMTLHAGATGRIHLAGHQARFQVINISIVQLIRLTVLRSVVILRLSRLTHLTVSALYNARRVIMRRRLSVLRMRRRIINNINILLGQK